MGGKVWKYDCYDLRKFKTGSIDLFVDIGAAIGSVSTMARILFPFARVIAFEPRRYTFDALKLYTRKLSIECYNVALGPGTPMCLSKGQHRGFDRFIDEQNKSWWPTEDRELVSSQTLPQMFENCKIDQNSRYILKIDCEGGERYLLNDEAFALIQNSMMTCFEIHIGFGGTVEDWSDVYNRIKETHCVSFGEWKFDPQGNRLRYNYIHSDHYPTRKHQVQFLNRSWLC